MIDAEIAKYFGYQEKDAIVNLMQSVQYIFSHSKDEPLFDEILMLSDISMDAPMFLKHLEEQLRAYANKVDSTSYYPKVQKSPSPLQESVVTWLYYALYWAYKLDMKTKPFSYPHSLSRIVLLFHKHYLHYKSEEKRQLGTKEDYQGKDFFENIAQGLTRALEYMAVMAREEDAHLSSVYFSKHIKDDLALHFLKLASSDMLEKNYFYIMKQKNKDDNYLLYENIAEEIRLKVKLSRILRSGDDAKTLRNQKIVGYFAKDLLQYQKLKAVVFKGEKGGGKGGGKKNNGIQYTQREDFDDVLYVPNSQSSEILSQEEEQEVLQKEI